MKPVASTTRPETIEAEPIRPIKGKSVLQVLVTYLTEYFKGLPFKSLLFTVLLLGVLITLNYTIGIESRIRDLRPLPLSFLSFFLFYTFVFFGVWGIQFHFGRRNGDGIPFKDYEIPFKDYDIPFKENEIPFTGKFLLLLVLGPLFFAAKMIHWDLSFLVPG